MNEFMLVDIAAVMAGEMSTEVRRADGTTFRAIFRRAFTEALGMESYKPLIICATADAQFLSQGDLLTVNGVDYEVAGAPQPRGMGLTDINLKEDV